MNRKFLLVLTAGILIISAGVLIAWYNSENPGIDLSQTILFFGDGCSHCANVEKFLADNKIEEKIKIIKKEIPFGEKTGRELTNNSKILLGRAQFCGVDTAQVGIPFLWNGKTKTCLIGDVDIINYFKKEAGI